MSDTPTPKVFRTVMVPVGRVRRPERNPNVMADAEYAALVHAIRTTGFLQPVLLRGEEPPRAPTAEDPPEEVERLLAEEAVWRLRPELLDLVDGDHRLQAALDCGLPEVPAVVGYFDERTARLLQIGMNRMRGELDLGSVGRILDELVAEGASLGDLSLCGYPEADITGLLEAMKPDAEDLADVGAVGSGAGGDPGGEEPEQGAWVLEVHLNTRKELNAARKALRKLGGGDMRAGLLKALADDEDGV